MFMGFVLGRSCGWVDLSGRKAVLLRLTPRTLFLMPALSIMRNGLTLMILSRLVRPVPSALATMAGSLPSISRSFGRGETIYDRWHYVPVLARKPGALRNGVPFEDRVLPPDSCLA